MIERETPAEVEIKTVEYTELRPGLRVSEPFETTDECKLPKNFGRTVTEDIFARATGNNDLYTDHPEYHFRLGSHTTVVEDGYLSGTASRKLPELSGDHIRVPLITWLEIKRHQHWGFYSYQAERPDRERRRAAEALARRVGHDCRVIEEVVPGGLVAVIVPVKLLEIAHA